MAYRVYLYSCDKSFLSDFVLHWSGSTRDRVDLFESLWENAGSQYEPHVQKRKSDVDINRNLPGFRSQRAEYIRFSRVQRRVFSYKKNTFRN